MSNVNKVLKGWEERVISHEKGNRVVQYHLVDNNGNSLLAVVGSDRGQRHMTYTVKGDFLRVLGPMTSVPAGTRWKSRKTVVAFLSSITSARGQILADPNELKIHSVTPPKKAWMARFSSEFDNAAYKEGSAAEGSCGLHQMKKVHVEKKLALRDPQGSSKAEGSRVAALLSQGPSASGDKKATSSATVDYKPRKRIAGVEPSRPNGSSAASGVSLNNAVGDLRAGIWYVPKSNDRRA